MPRIPKYNIRKLRYLITNSMLREFFCTNYVILNREEVMDIYNNNQLGSLILFILQLHLSLETRGRMYLFFLYTLYTEAFDQLVIFLKVQHLRLLLLVQS